MSKRSWSLFVKVGENITEHAIEAETKVGRGPECSVKIRHQTCSKMHFIVRSTGGEVTLEHGHPVNENPRGKWASIRTFVNGTQIPGSTSLALGDVITLKEHPDLDGVSIEVQETQNPAARPPEGTKPWWKFW